MFIEKIYRGYFDPDLFRASKPDLDHEKVDRVIGVYRMFLQNYTPDSMEEEGRIPPDLLREMGAAGFFGLSIDPEYGGGGLNLWEYLTVVEEMVRLDISIAITFLAHLSIGIKGIQLFGNEAQRQRYLPRAASGEMIFSYALTEPRIGSDAQHIETAASLAPDGSHYILNGQKAYITNANYAGGLTVFAQFDPKRPGFMGALIVETGWEGVKVGEDIPKMGLKASSTAAIQFKNVRVPVENLIGRPGDGFKIAMSVLNYGRLGLGAASTALMGVSLQDMVKRASSRIQFQVPIKNFQLIQEKIVRTKVNVAVSSAMNNFIAGLLQENRLANTAIETSHCKLFGTTRAWDAVYDALQVAGGSGYLKTFPYEKRMRDFRVATVFEGTTEIHSIYPALFGMRRIGNELEKSGGSVLSMFGQMVKLLAKRTKWNFRFKNTVMQKAFKQAEMNARRMRRLILMGMVLYGKEMARGDIGRREFLLRRITTLSMYMFGILALLSELDAGGKKGPPTEKDLHVLRYFTEEAKEVCRLNKHLFDSGREKLGSAIFGDMERVSG